MASTFCCHDVNVALRRKPIFLLVGVVIGTYAVLAVVLHFVFPVPLPDASVWPRPGDVLVSEMESVHQTVVGIDGDQLVIGELVLGPHAAGPPFPHYHEGFEEDFAVAEGRLGLELDGQTRFLGPGERYAAPAGVRHRPFNPTGARVVLRVPEGFKLPGRFVTCLDQLYRFVDRPGNAGFRTALQLSLMQGYCDIHFTGLFGLVQRPLFIALEPIARASGFKSYYPGNEADHWAAR
jgi:mannose-6-phosphate isomerase-like protein (cupin superfamily)